MELNSSVVVRRAVPLPEANTLAHVNFHACHYGRVLTSSGQTILFNPEIVLVKFRHQSRVSAVRVESGHELEATRALAGRPDVEFAELDCLQQREFHPNDPLLTNQWHHAIIGSFAAWDRSLGSASVQIAIVDTPFQMNHPDLAAHVTDGWDVVMNGPITGSRGIVHSTMCAGMAAAVINNQLGVSGAANCTILPININGLISEMCNAVYWAADHGVRVVSVSWDGAYSDALNAAGSYLRTKARGILVMSGVNGTGYLNYTNQPDIWCVSMTDAADNLQSCYGPHIDFAAPGWNILSTTTGDGYAYGSGTSYATPLVAGIVAVLFSLNPTLSPVEAVDILRSTAVDKYGPGWNEFFGWGRVDFGAAVNAAAATLPVITSLVRTNSQVLLTATSRPGVVTTLWRTASPSNGPWTPVIGAAVATNGAAISFLDPDGSASRAFYRVEANVP